jgi:3'-5' exoribonuclease
MLNQKELSRLAKGDEVNHFLIIRKCEPKTSKTNKQYLSLELGDNTCTLPGNLWDNFSDFLSSAAAGAVVKVDGSIDDYNGTPQLKINRIRLAVTADNVSAEDFIPRSKRDLDEMKNELKDRINRINNRHLRSLINLVLNGETKKKFLKAPAGKSWHHSYLHGLLEHTLEIIKICDFMSDIHPEVNRDLLITGALFHDLGKVEELVFDSVFDYSDKGKLIGHIVIAAMEINEKAKQIQGFPEELKNQLIHLILSHQGKLEFASPVIPKTLESIILYQADELSAKTNAYKSAIQLDANGNNKWTKYLPLVSTSLYIAEDFGKNNLESGQSLFD